MKKRLFRKRFRIVSTFVLTLQILLAGFLSIIKEVRTLITYAALGNQVFLTSTEYEANDSNIVYATIRFEANAGDQITVHYRTFNGTAIDGYDYQGASNSITVTMPQNEVTEYKIAIKCLNDTTNRQYFNVTSGSRTFGRYFNIELTKVENAVFREESLKRAKCYLGYSHKVSATVGVRDSVISGEIAYLNEYANMQMEYEGGVSDLDGGSNRKTWSHGMSFNNETTRSWIPTFIDSGYAEAYASFVVQTIDDGIWDDGGRESVLAGNKEFIENWKVSKDVPGLFVYFKVNPPGTRLDGRAMKYIANGTNPYKKDKNLVDAEIKYVAPNHKPISWIAGKDTWFSSKNSVYESEFWKIDPYKGVLDAGIMSHNHNWESDMMFKKIWGMMTLYDDKNPTLIKDYAEYNSENGSIRFYLRFSEPVYSSQTGSTLTVNFNNSTQNFYANYVEGNYSDTLVYEVPTTPALQTKIESITYELPNNDIGDMAYKLDSYKLVHNNRVQNTDQKRHPELANGVIDLSKPTLAADPASSLAPHNYYNILLDTNGGSTSTFREGTVYYLFDNNETIANPEDPASYKDGFKHVLTSEEQGSFSITLSKNASVNYPSGTYYLHALAVSNFGFTSIDTFGPYTLDGDAPVVTLLPMEENKLMTKIFAFEVENKSIGTAIKDISLVAKFKEDDKEKTLKHALVKDEVILQPALLSKTEETNKTIYHLQSNIDTSKSIPIDVFIKDLLGDKMRFVTEIGFEAIDSAGNRGTSEFIKVVYDIREGFENEITYPESYVEDSTIDVGEKVFNIHGAPATDGITFTIKDGETPITPLVDGGAKYSVIINEEEEIFADEGDPYTVILTDLKPGHYDFVAHISGESGGAEVDLISATTSIYLSDDFKDDTANKVKSSGNLVLTNHVYQIEDARFYYLQGESAIGSHLYGAIQTEQAGKYEGGSSSPTFSNHNEAKKYMKFMEYQDLDLISISDSIASLLNNGTSLTVYAKAAGETMYAQEGQLWIRYKKKTFSVDNVGTNGWAYYYYGSGSVESGIDVNSLSENLRSSIDTVVNGIVSRGSEKYLVTEDDLDQKSYAPYLTQSQIHVDEETATNTKTGIPYVSYPIYPGDKNIYKNTVHVAEQEYPLATNMPLTVSKSTTLYYQIFGGETWSRIECEDGALLKDVLSDNVPGVYTIREYDENGVSQFNVYLDKQLPEVHATVTNALGPSDITLDGTSDAITCKSLAITSIINEADDLAYVAIYSYPAKSLIKVLYPEDVQGYVLSGANYYVQVGDRSGNTVSYRVLTSDSPIDMSVVENEDKTAVIVRVNNREEAEIYEFAVYLNEVLIDSTFDTYKIYRDPGVYRVEITDIYNNTDYVTLTHETPSPRLTWYYLNEGGGYSQYDPNNPVRLILEDSVSSPRTTYVYSSTLVKIQMSSAYDNQDIEFEVNGLESGEYAYNSTSGILTINSLASWTLRVWYSNSPESDRSYVFILDNDAPEIGGSLIGVTYHPLVEYDEDDQVIGTASFDVLKPGYQDDDPISLDYLDSVNDGNANVEFTNGGVVSGNRIVVLVTDPSGIRSVSVTRNGQPVQAELNSDNQLILTNYGLYVITVTDNLGNVSTFSFTNVEKGIANGLVDGETINENEVTSGHDSLEVSTFYEGTNTILVKDGENSYTYVFNYDGEKVTYGQYYVTTEEYVDKDDEIKSQQVAEFIENLDFIIYSKGDNAKLNTWFVAVENEGFIIYTLIDDNLNVHYRVACVDEEITVESSFSVGKTHLPAHYEAQLSKEIPEITLLTDGEEVEIIEGLDYIYITNELTIDEASVSSNIEKIEFAFNADAAVFDEYETIYENGEWKSDFVKDEFGFYQIIVTNKYNNQTVYTINKIESFSSFVTIYTLDGSEVKFYESREWIYSNSAIELSVVSDNVHFEVNGSPTSGLSEGGITTLYLDRAGVYEVKVVGANGITEDFNFEIKNDVEFVYDESWMTGYNEQALLRDQGYTNQPLTVHVGEDVVFIDVVINDEEHIVLYDNITEDKQPNEDELVEVIGKFGVGKYVVGFRNKYGDLVKKTIYFNNVSSLELNRIILSDPNTYQNYDLAFAIEKGYYSNYLLGFSTTSETYRFTINGDEYRLDTMKTLEFSNPNGKGSFTYHITFLDEYGNYIEFDAILQREDVVFDSSSMNIINNNGVYYTKDDICITFADGLKATLTVNGGETVDYYSGQMRYQDGEYVFVVRDIAGNNVTFVINHKSVNHYTLTNSANGQVVIDGGVVNDGSILFTSEDGSRILYVVRNGELVSDFNSNTFSQTGHYEIIIIDAIGNMSYEEFYVINNSLAEFTYTAPLDYEVTEVWRVKPDGSKEQMNFKGATLTLNQDGDYVVVVTSAKTTNSFNFTITIDNTKPSATLVGAVEGGVTAEDVSFSNLKVGDVVKVYRNGELISTTVIGVSEGSPEITTGGKYRVTVTNVQGLTVEYNFTRKAIANVAGSIFIIVSSTLVIVGIGIGLIYHTKLKTDD